MVVKLVLFACYFAASAAAVCDGDCEASPAVHGAALLQAKARAGAEHEQNVLLMMAQNPKATQEACDACVTAQEFLVTPQKALATAMDDLAIAAHAFVSASKNHVACSAADCEATLAGKAEAEELIAIGDAAVVAATRAVSDADTAAHAACDAVREGTGASTANAPAGEALRKLCESVPIHVEALSKLCERLMPNRPGSRGDAHDSPATTTNCGSKLQNMRSKVDHCDLQLKDIKDLATKTKSKCKKKDSKNRCDKKVAKKVAELVKQGSEVDETR